MLKIGHATFSKCLERPLGAVEIISRNEDVRNGSMVLKNEFASLSEQN
jgi:hypothetical protein